MKILGVTLATLLFVMIVALPPLQDFYGSRNVWFAFYTVILHVILGIFATVKFAQWFFNHIKDDEDKN